MVWLEDNEPEYLLVESPDFKYQAGEFFESFDRFREIHETILRDLVRDPFVGWGYTGVPGFRSILLSSRPQLILHYQIDEAVHTVTLWEIEYADP